MFRRDIALRVALAEGKKYAEDERQRYEQFYRIGEEYASTHGLLLGGDAAVTALVADGKADGKEPPTELHWYTKRPWQHTKNIANALYAADPDGLAKYTTALTRIQGELYWIQLDGRLLFVIHHIATEMGSLIVDSPYASLQVKCLSVEAILIEICRQLADPALAENWEQLYHHWSSLTGLVSHKRGGKRRGTDRKRRGTDGKRRGTDGKRRGTDGKRRKRIAEAVRAMLREEVRLDAEGSRQLVYTSERRLEDEVDRLGGLASSMNVPFYSRIDDPKIPLNNEIRRLHVRFGSKERPVQVVHIYNFGSIELVPWVTIESTGSVPDVYRRGGPWVEARARLIDLWTVALLYDWQVLKTPTYNDMKQDATQRYLEVVERIYSANDVTDLFPRDYIGSRVPARIREKRYSVKMRNKKWIPPFMPRRHRNKKLS